MRRLHCCVLLGLLLAGGAAAQTVPDAQTHAQAQAQPQAQAENELEPIIVEAQRDPLDVIGRHRDQLPCIGACPDESDEETAFQRFLRGLEQLSIYGRPDQKPEPVQALGVVNPIKSRLDDKQP